MLQYFFSLLKTTTQKSISCGDSVVNGSWNFAHISEILRGYVVLFHKQGVGISDGKLVKQLSVGSWLLGAASLFYLLLYWGSSSIKGHIVFAWGISFFAEKITDY